ncbi:TSR2 [Candida pseudojiufengensis]|uniref:TSR2 n=1 Tax=Candida pseudojiufengensis TaxID=497109 RepID=UPI00222411C4|nr:TSR2 [Candida pseudojiufengensis]KAI5961247.1 TSR2 [Candida pseudojiufengensis]
MATISIDPTEYVEVEQGTLQFPNTHQQAKFELGVCMAIYKWEELATAVENSWGGANSSEKRDWISGVIIDLFSENKAVDIQLIEETLLYAMVDEFDTEVDNDSALEIGALIMRFYKDVQLEKYDSIEELYKKWNDKKSLRVANSKVHIEEDPNNPDSSDDEEDDEEETEDIEMSNGDDMVIDKEEPKGPIVDDDGFELVQKKGRRR